MSARTPPARHRRRRVRAARAAGKLPPIPDVVAVLAPLEDLGPLDDDPGTVEPYRVPEVVEEQKRRRMN